MKKTVKITTLFVSVLLISASCGKKKQDEIVEGYEPIYATADDLENVEVKANEPLENPGRIYTYENYLLVNDQSKGIHIYDNSNQNNPTHLSFIAIPGNMDFSVKNGVLYADNITDMVIIDITNPVSPTYVNRISSVFPVQQFPDEFGAFECVDPSKGMVIGWKKTMLTNPKCYK